MRASYMETIFAQLLIISNVIDLEKCCEHLEVLV